MVRRRGVGATMAASLVFSVILVAGALVYAAAQGRETLYATADGEDALADGFHILIAAEGVNILLGVQGIVSSQTLGCSSALTTVAREVGTLVGLQAADGLAVGSQAETVDIGDSPDNLSALHPFNGTVAGDLDLALSFKGSGSRGAATFNRAESHYAHLGVRIDRAVLDCQGAADAIGEALNGTTLPVCTSAAVGRVVDGALQGPGSTARADGFQLGASYFLTTSGPCEVFFTVTLDQSSIQGPGGPFTARFEEAGAASPDAPGP